MVKKAKGPIKFAEWESALKLPLDYENAAYLRRGKFKQKEDMGRLFNLIADYVIDTFNSEMGAVKREDDDIVFALDRFIAALNRIDFYRELDFLPDKDKISESLNQATKGLIKYLLDKFGDDNADIVYAIGVLRRKTEVLL